VYNKIYHPSLLSYTRQHFPSHPVIPSHPLFILLLYYFIYLFIEEEDGERIEENRLVFLDGETMGVERFVL
jgi:hypothetical protein